MGIVTCSECGESFEWNDIKGRIPEEEENAPRCQKHTAAEVYDCWLCHDTEWLCDAPGGGVRVLCRGEAIGVRRHMPPFQTDIEKARADGLNPRRCHACAEDSEHECQEG